MQYVELLTDPDSSDPPRLGAYGRLTIADAPPGRRIGALVQYEVISIGIATFGSDAASVTASSGRSPFRFGM